MCVVLFDFEKPKSGKFVKSQILNLQNTRLVLCTLTSIALEALEFAAVAARA